MEQKQLGLGRRHEREADSGAPEAGAPLEQRGSAGAESHAREAATAI